MSCLLMTKIKTDCRIIAANQNTPTHCFIDFLIATEVINVLNLKCCFFDSILEEK